VWPIEALMVGCLTVDPLLAGLTMIHLEGRLYISRLSFDRARIPWNSLIRIIWIL